MDNKASQTHSSLSCLSLSLTSNSLRLCNAENNQNETAGGHENTLLFGFIARVVWGTALALLSPQSGIVLTVF